MKTITTSKIKIVTKSLFPQGVCCCSGKGRLYVEGNVTRVTLSVFLYSISFFINFILFIYLFVCFFAFFDLLLSLYIFVMLFLLFLLLITLFFMLFWLCYSYGWWLFCSVSKCVVMYLSILFICACMCVWMLGGMCGWKFFLLVAGPPWPTNLFCL